MPSMRGQNICRVEFKSLRESTTESGIREIERAMIMGAAVVRDPILQTNERLKFVGLN